MIESDMSQAYATIGAQMEQCGDQFHRAAEKICKILSDAFFPLMQHFRPNRGPGSHRKLAINRMRRVRSAVRKTA